MEEITLNNGGSNPGEKGFKGNTLQQLPVVDWLADLPETKLDTDLVEVQFKNTRKGYFVNSEHIAIEKGDMVAVEANPGHDIGVVTLMGRLVLSQIKKNRINMDRYEVRKVYRKVKPVDMEKYEEAKAKEQATMIRARKIAKDMQLAMKIGDVEYQGDGSKAIFYYKKALSFYDGVTDLNAKNKSLISQIIYDIATLYLYMHKYDECEKFLSLSNTYDSSENQQRTYVTAILYAVQGRVNDSRNLLDTMSSFLRMNCEPMIEAITAKKDPHYCVVEQDKSAHTDFWNKLIEHKADLEKLVASKKNLDVQKNVSEILSTTLSFMKRQIACRIEASDVMITVYCKNYYVKTLIEEYESLFSIKPNELNNWRFVSVNEFENY